MQAETKRVLITGASGQIGTELTRALRDRFGVENVIASDLCSGSEQQHNLDEEGPFIAIDVTEKAVLRAVVEDESVDTIVHLAALLSWDSEKEPDLAWEVNVIGTMNVLNLARDRKLTQVFLPSSIAVFGPNTSKEKTPTDTILRPATMYGVTKVTGELVGKYYAKRWGLDVRGVRYPGIISAERLPSGGTTDYAVEMFYAAVKGEPYTCFVKKETRLPMMYMPDCIKATLDLMAAPRDRLVHHTDFNICGLSFTAEALASAIRRHIPDFECRYAPDERQRIADAWPHTLDDTPAREEWGWRPAFDLESMTLDMLERLRGKRLKNLL